MRIEEDLKLGFKDVLIRPKRSTLKSRSDVELERQFTFKHSGQTWSCLLYTSPSPRDRSQACDGFHRDL